MQENLILLHEHNNGTDQPAHQHSLINTFIILLFTDWLTFNQCIKYMQCGYNNWMEFCIDRRSISWYWLEVISIGLNLFAI